MIGDGPADDKAIEEAELMGRLLCLSRFRILGRLLTILGQRKAESAAAWYWSKPLGCLFTMPRCLARRNRYCSAHERSSVSVLLQYSSSTSKVVLKGSYRTVIHGGVNLDDRSALA